MKFCTGMEKCHTNTLSLNRCEGVMCTIDLDCLSASCIGGSCSDNKTCATSQSADKNKCHGVLCLHKSECKAYNGNQTCLDGYCSENSTCSSHPKALMNRCHLVNCTYNSECSTGYCEGNKCVYFQEVKGVTERSLIAYILIPIGVILLGVIICIICKKRANKL